MALSLIHIWTVKQMESQKKKLEEQLKSLSDESRKGAFLNSGKSSMQRMMNEWEKATIR